MIKEVFDKMSREGSGVLEHLPMYRDLVSKVVNSLHLHVPPPATIFDPSCGEGLIAESINEGYSLLLSDLSPIALDNAKRRLGNVSNIEFLDPMDATEEIIDRDIDAILHINLLHNVYDYSSAVYTASKMLPNNGIYIVSGRIKPSKDQEGNFIKEVTKDINRLGESLKKKVSYIQEAQSAIENILSDFQFIPLESEVVPFFEGFGLEALYSDSIYYNTGYFAVFRKL